ncbi:MAG: hypothetical protein WC803_10090 [Sphingomonas sp.]|jgi:hypothetical protein
MTPDELADAIEAALRAADALGLTDVGMKLNDAVMKLGRGGTVPPGWADMISAEAASPTERERWAEALAIERIHGEQSPLWIAGRIEALALAGDEAGVGRFQEIATLLDRLLHPRAGNS